VRAAVAARITLATAPIELRGDWGGSLPNAAKIVVSRMRDVSLAGVRLVSDRQPAAVVVDSHTSGPPYIWLHDGSDPSAWIIVDTGPRDWSRLAYQFGHELGHVLCNSWGPDAAPRNPCQWLEEALAEAFSIRGLGLLADSWTSNPPFPGDAAFGGAITGYRNNLLTQYRTVAAEQGAIDNLAVWFRSHRDALETDGGVNGATRGIVSACLEEMETDPACVEGLGALNRWPERSGAPIEDYLRSWDQSCTELGASRRLPARLKSRLLG
jgi:hypothetical protein